MSYKTLNHAVDSVLPECFIPDYVGDEKRDVNGCYYEVS